MIKRILAIVNAISVVVLINLNVFVWKQLEPYESYSIVEHKNFFGMLIPYDYTCDCDYGVLEYEYGSNELIYKKRIDFDRVHREIAELPAGTYISDEPVTDKEKIKASLDGILGQYYDLSKLEFKCSIKVRDNDYKIFYLDDLIEASSYDRVVITASYGEYINGFSTGEFLRVILNQNGKVESAELYETDIYEKYSGYNIDTERYKTQIEKKVKNMCVNSEYPYLYCDVGSEYLIEHNGRLCIYTVADGVFDAPHDYNERTVGVSFLTPLSGVQRQYKVMTTVISLVFFTGVVLLSVYILRKRNRAVTVTEDNERGENEGL